MHSGTVFNNFSYFNLELLRVHNRRDISVNVRVGRWEMDFWSTMVAKVVYLAANFFQFNVQAKTIL